MRVRAVRPSLVVLALAVVSASRCDCTTEVPLPPPPIGEGDPIGPPDAGDVYEADAGPVVCDDDANEENDAREDAVPLESDVEVEGTSCGDDDDWYSIAAAPGCSVLAEMTQGAGAVGDVDMLVFDPDGQLVGSSSTAGRSTAGSASARRSRPPSMPSVAPRRCAITPGRICSTEPCATLSGSGHARPARS